VNAVQQLPQPGGAWLSDEQYDSLTNLAVQLVRAASRPMKELNQLLVRRLVEDEVRKRQAGAVVWRQVPDDELRLWFTAVKNALQVLRYANVLSLKKGWYSLGAQWDRHMRSEQMARMRRKNAFDSWYELPVLEKPPLVVDVEAL
jgi:hypothetical protein